MEKYFLHGKLKAKAGKGGELASILMDSSASGMKGCNIYLLSKDNADADTIWITEVWDSKEDHDNSLKLESVKAAIARAMPIIDGMPEKGQELKVIGGLGA